MLVGKMAAGKQRPLYVRVAQVMYVFPQVTCIRIFAWAQSHKPPQMPIVSLKSHLCNLLWRPRHSEHAVKLDLVIDLVGRHFRSQDIPRHPLVQFSVVVLPTFFPKL